MIIISDVLDGACSGLQKTANVKGISQIPKLPAYPEGLANKGLQAEPEW